MSTHPFQQDNIADHARALRESIASKSATRPRVDSQGTPTEALVTYEYDEFGLLIGPFKKKD